MPPLRHHGQISTHAREPYGHTGGYVLKRQRKQQKTRKKGRVICEFQGNTCPFMVSKDRGVFSNIAELKEDALRHLNPFQCERCGKRFGKRYGRKRHKDPEKKRNPCIPVEGGLGGDGKPVVWLSRELVAAVLDLEDAKGEEDVIAAIDKCKLLCNMNGGLRIPNLEAQSRCQDNLEQTMATTDPGAPALQQDNNIPLAYSPHWSSPPQSPLAAGGPGHLSYGVPCSTTGDATVNWRAGTYMNYGDEPSGSRELIMIQQGTDFYDSLDPDLHGASIQDLSPEAGGMESVPAGARPTAHGTLQLGFDTSKGPPTYYAANEALPLGPPRVSFYQDPSFPSTGWLGAFAMEARERDPECMSLSPAAVLGVGMLAGNDTGRFHNSGIQHKYQDNPPAFLHYHSQDIFLFGPNASAEPTTTYAGHGAGHPATAYPPLNLIV